MRSLLVVLVVMSAFGGPLGFACSCVAPPPDIKTPRQAAEWRAKGADAIFEGKVRDIKLHWKLMEAPAGELLPADLDQDDPNMIVSFDVSRSYRGAQGKILTIETGLGGGDCGFDFEIGKQYLVYAWNGDDGKLSTGICSGTALLRDSAANLAYLRGEAVIPEAANRSEETRTGKICGRVVYDKLSAADDQLFFFREGQVSPVPSDDAELSDDGSFCADGLTPARYRVAFVDAASETPDVFSFFPGVEKSSEATLIKVSPGQKVSGLIFRVPTADTFSVRGNVTMPDGSRLPSGLRVVLVSAEGAWPLIGGAQYVRADGAFVFPQVLPGKYWAIVDIDSNGVTSWLTRKVEVEVHQNVTSLALQLIPN